MPFWTYGVGNAMQRRYVQIPVSSPLAIIGERRIILHRKGKKEKEKRGTSPPRFLAIPTTGFSDFVQRLR